MFHYLAAEAAFFSCDPDGSGLKWTGVLPGKRQGGCKLNQHLQEVREYGIDGVPIFVIGNKMVIGAQPYQVLEGILSEELANDNGV